MKRIAMLFAALIAHAGLALAAVNINSATKEQLESLDGVGPVKAQAIVDYRRKHGRFKTLEDLKKVDGIGEGTFEKVRSKISLSGPTTITAADAKAAPKAPSRPATRTDPKKEAADKKK